MVYCLYSDRNDNYWHFRDVGLGTYGGKEVILSEITNSIIGPWTNLTAVGALIVVTVYLITKAIPAMNERFYHIMQLYTDSFRESLDKQREDFRAEMMVHRKETSDLMREGHIALNDLSKHVQDLSNRLVEPHLIRRDGK